MKRALLVLGLLGACAIPDYEFTDTLPLQGTPKKTCTNGGLCIDGALVTNDADDDGKLSPGETATVTVWARNGLARDATGVFAKLTDLPQGASIRDCFSYYAECSGSCTCVGGSVGFPLDAGTRGELPLLRFEITLSTGVTATELRFGVDLSDDYDQTWHDTFTLAAALP